MKVRLKNHDYVNNVDAGTIFDALNERGGEFDYDFPYWHGWVKDRSGNRKFLSYSKEELELVLRSEVAAFFNKIESGRIVVTEDVPKSEYLFLPRIPRWTCDNKLIKEIREDYVSFNLEDGSKYISFTREEALFFKKMMRRINRPAANGEDKKLLEVLNTL